MKTAQIMTRNLNGLPVRQNHKTGMFNANDLLNIYNSGKRKQKRLDVYLNTGPTQDYIEVIREDLSEDNPNHSNSSELEFDFDDLNTTHGCKLARPESVMKTSRGKHGGTWMHPYLFIDFAMWLSPEFKLQCMKWLSDHLIKFRDQAGNSFKEVNAALTLADGEQRQHIYIQEARMINGLVFENGKGGQRNDASEAELDMIDRLQKADIKMIHAGKDFKTRERSLMIFRNLSV